MVLGASSDNLLSWPMKLSRLHWLGHMLCMTKTRPPYPGLFSVPPTKWKNPLGVSTLYRMRRIKADLDTVYYSHS